jgi:hypothetical protein
VKALTAGGSSTLTYPSASETHVGVDEFFGITGIDTSSGATGTTTAFSSCTALVITQALRRPQRGASQMTTATGAYAATGTTVS